MDDKTFTDGLKDDEDRRQEWQDAAAAMVRLRQPLAEEPEKTAGIKDHLGSFHHLIPTAESIPFLVAGGALAGGLTYAGTRPSKDHPGQSKSEVEHGKVVASHEPEDEKTGLPTLLAHRTNEFAHGVSKAFKKHPVKSTLLMTGVGAGAGAGLARAVNAIRGKGR